MKIPASPAVLTILLSATALAGCARESAGYPSLAPRAVEKLGFAEPDVPVVVTQPDPALDAQIGALTLSLQKVASGFTADANRAEMTTRRANGAAAGSDAWLEAQTALAGLDDWRAQASALVTDIDQIATERATKLLPPYPALTDLHAQAQAEADRQDATIERLQGALKPA